MLVLSAGLQFLNISNDWRDMLDKGQSSTRRVRCPGGYLHGHQCGGDRGGARGGVGLHPRGPRGHRGADRGPAWEVPWSSRVDSLVNYNHSEAVEDDLNVERLVDDAAALSDEDLARIKEIALNEPSVAGPVSSPATGALPDW